MKLRTLIAAAVAAAFALPLAAQTQADKAPADKASSGSSPAAAGGTASAGASASSKAADAMFKDLDKNGDSFISREEAKVRRMSRRSTRSIRTPTASSRRLNTQPRMQTNPRAPRAAAQPRRPAAARLPRAPRLPRARRATRGARKSSRSLSQQRLVADGLIKYQPGRGRLLFAYIRGCGVEGVRLCNDPQRLVLLIPNRLSRDSVGRRRGTQFAAIAQLP